MRRTSHLFAVACVALLVLATGTSCAAQRSAPRAHRASTWHGATAFDHWAGWAKREIVRGGASAVRADGVDATAYTVRPGDVPGKNGERSEVAASVRDTGAQPGHAVHYHWGTFFPADFQPVPDSTWTIFTQLHESAADGCHPNLALQVDTQHGDDQLRLTARGGQLDTRTCEPASTNTWDFATLQREHWYRFDLFVGWSASARDGFVELTVDGRTVVPRTPQATLYRGQSVYFKQGLYRQASDFAATVLHTGVTRSAPEPINGPGAQRARTPR